MIALTFIHPVTGLDQIWEVSVKNHSALEEKRKIAIADAGDYIDPDTHYKGGYETTQIISNPISVDEIDTFYLMRKGTEKGQPIEVGGSVVPLVGSDYSAIREGNLKAVELHGGRYFSFVLNLRVLSLL